MGIENMDITKLLAEAGEEVDALIKAERQKMENLKKSQEAADCAPNKANGDVMKKEESSVEKSGKKAAEMMKKDEGSGYQNQAPEASDAPPAAPEDGSMPADDGQDQGEDLHSMVSSLDDEMLHELAQVVQMEMSARQSQQGDQPPADASASMSPDQSQSAPPMDKSAMMYKAELEMVKQKLAKSEVQAANLEKSFTGMTELLDKMINRPIVKAVTDIRNIDYVDKGEKDLKKSEVANISDADLQKKAKEMAMDNKTLSSLSKNERDVLGSFLTNKKRTPEVLKLFIK